MHTKNTLLWTIRLKYLHTVRLSGCSKITTLASAKNDVTLVSPQLIEIS